MSFSGLALHRLLLRSALSGGHIFAWVLIFQYFYIQHVSISAALISVLAAYALSQVITVLATPWSARMLRNGFRKPLVYAALTLAIAFGTLGAAFSGLIGDIGVGIAATTVLLGLYRALYWIPYEVASERQGAWSTRAIEFGLALLPAIAGVYMTSSGALAIHVLFAAGALSLLSIVPLMSLRDTHEGYQWGYRESFHELFSYARRRVLIQSILSGAEAIVLLLVWPLAIFMLTGWSYAMLGLILSLTLIFTMVTRMLFGAQIAQMPPRLVPAVAASAWVMRLGVGGFVGAVLVDTYAQAGAHASVRGMDTQTHEHVADNRTFVDEYTALKEMGNALGRITAAFSIIALIAVFPAPIALALSFIGAGLAAGFLVYYQKRVAVRL